MTVLNDKSFYKQKNNSERNSVKRVLINNLKLYSIVTIK